MPQPVVLVRHRRVWCLAKYRRTKRYTSAVETACGYLIQQPLVVATTGTVTCAECMAVAHRKVKV